MLAEAQASRSTVSQPSCSASGCAGRDARCVANQSQAAAAHAVLCCDWCLCAGLANAKTVDIRAEGDALKVGALFRAAAVQHWMCIGFRSWPGHQGVGVNDLLDGIGW
jgi:hypothetical protein